MRGPIHLRGYHACPSNRKGRAVRSVREAVPRSGSGARNASSNPDAMDECDSEICRRKHVVYVAFHGDMVKIGMTSSLRLRERGIEQGADAIAPLVECENRMAARAAENPDLPSAEGPADGVQEGIPADHDALSRPKPLRAKIRPCPGPGLGHPSGHQLTPTDAGPIPDRVRCQRRGPDHNGRRKACRGGRRHQGQVPGVPDKDRQGT